MPTLRVVAVSDAFHDVWPELARELGLELRLARTPEELEPEPAGLAPLLVVAGSEHGAEPLVRAVLAAGGAAPALVGVEAEHRLVVTLLQAGAADYYALPAELELLRARLADGVRRERERTEGARLALAERKAFDFSRIVGESPQLRQALDRAARVIPRGAATVLITGETGTGKELLAQAIHYNGPRAAAPFVELNCAAIPGQLLESELFGHEKGAFTDARAAKPGLFEAADGGTLFLDEIGHLPFALQGKILKALDERRIRRVGALRERGVDVRIIAATHVVLPEAVRRGEFREDLYYRLSVIPIHLPALRERGSDVLLLAEHFLSTLAAQYDLSAPALDAGVRRLLLAHPWPGNVRELRNALERALLLGDGRVDPADLFPGQPAPPPAADGAVLPFPAPLTEIEEAAANAMVDRLAGNKRAAAHALGISRSRLYRLLERGGVSE